MTDLFVFQNDLSIVAYSHSGWHGLFILPSNYIRNKIDKTIVYEFQKITQHELKTYYDAHMQDADGDDLCISQKMQVSVYNILSGCVKGRIHHLQAKIKFNGPSLVYYLLMV